MKSRNDETYPFYRVFGAQVYSPLEMLYLYNNKLNIGPSSATSIWLPVKASSKHIRAACRRCSDITQITFDELIDITLAYAVSENTDEVLIIFNDGELSLYDNNSEDRPRFSSWFRKTLTSRDEYSFVLH